MLPLFKAFKKEFYLAGGTALALQIGHRDSIDFDFFCEKDFDPQVLLKKIKDIFSAHKVTRIQEERNTLTILVNGKVKISFFTYNYPLLQNKVEEKYIDLASIRDIALMKMSAVLSRASYKDYIDLYFILQDYDLAGLINDIPDKFNDLDANMVLKSLVYFNDVETEPILFLPGQEVDFEIVKKFLVARVREIGRSTSLK